MIDLLKLQNEVAVWSKKNFPMKQPHQPLLGAIEELGELAHAHLKQEQNIREHDYDAAIKDAVADCIIFLCDYCCQKGINLDYEVYSTWKEVSSRDWIKYPKNGKSE